MKKLFSLLAIIAIIVGSNCTKIPENNDPILGKWLNFSTRTIESKGIVEVKEEWIFNDVNLGRYHKYENNEIVVLTDFSWTRKNDQYKVDYSAFEQDPILLIMTLEEEQEQLALPDGELFATRE